MIQLPNGHVASAEVAVVDRGGLLTGIIGGDDQRVDRIGAKFAVTFTLRPLTAEQARIFIPRLLRAGRQMGWIRFPQPGIRNDVVGSFSVNAAQAANTESLGITAGNVADRGKTIWEGQAIEIQHGGNKFIHIVTANALINAANGTAVLALFPPLRRSLSVGAPVVITDPQMEGYPATEDQKWTIDVAKTRGLSFTITEAH